MTVWLRARTAPRVATVVTATLMLMSAVTASGQNIDIPGDDGWYSWSVPASTTGASSCCFRWQSGHGAAIRACDLDGAGGGYTLSGDCALQSGEVHVYVRMSGGQLDRVHALNADCRVTTASEITELGGVAPDTSVRWLAAQLTGEENRDSEILAAIPMHSGSAAFATLTAFLEDQDRPIELREQALFWLAQSDTDEAFQYLDRLLGSR